MPILPGVMRAQAVLSNGLRVFLVEDHDVPLVKTTLLFRGGLRTSRPDKVPICSHPGILLLAVSGLYSTGAHSCVQVGLATIAAGVQRAGGSVQHPSAALDDALEQKAAYIEGGATPETSSLGMQQS